jgi:hypothetical protein
VSGGQTGADRGALDAALSLAVPIGGWVPKGRLAEDGRIPDLYAGLTEAPSAVPADRTRRNVLDSDGTLIVAFGALEGGTALTHEVARELAKPCLVLDLGEPDAPARRADEARAWVLRHQISVLNVAGPRLSEDARAYARAFELVSALLAPDAR